MRVSCASSSTELFSGDGGVMKPSQLRYAMCTAIEMLRYGDANGTAAPFAPPKTEQLGKAAMSPRAACMEIVTA